MNRKAGINYLYAEASMISNQNATLSAPVPASSSGAACREDAAKVRLLTSEWKKTKGREPRYFIRTYGCQQNDHDSEIAAGILEEMGFSATDSMEDAELILFNTCSIRANADDRFFGNVGSLKPLKKNGHPIIGVMGCMMEQQIHVDSIKSTFPFVDFILGAGAMTTIPKALLSVLSSENGNMLKDLSASSAPSDAITAGMLPVRRRDRHRALISIMTGCNNFCTYCIVPYTRGREKSRPFKDILDEAKKAVREGAREIMLLGQNVNSYGMTERRSAVHSEDFPPFSELLAAISRLPNLFVLRYMTSHPKDLSDELIDVIGKCPTVEPHVHLPLQSGSDRILKKMNRRYDAAHFLNLVRKLRKARPGITISTDIIVGFPGEPEDDLEATLSVMREAAFDAAFTFIYSPREGTPAASWLDREKIPFSGEGAANEKEIHARFDRVAALQNRLSYTSNVRLEGQDVEVLVDGFSKKSPDIFSGRTRDNRLVNFSMPVKTTLSDNIACLLAKNGNVCPIAGDVVSVHIDRAKTFSLEGTLNGINV